MKIKVCGITTVEQLQALQKLGVDYAGFIFYPKSARYAGEKLEEHQKEIQTFLNNIEIAFFEVRIRLHEH